MSAARITEAARLISRISSYLYVSPHATVHDYVFAHIDGLGV